MRNFKRPEYLQYSIKLSGSSSKARTFLYAGLYEANSSFDLVETLLDIGKDLVEFLVGVFVQPS